MARPWELLLAEVAQQRWRRLVTHATFVSGSYSDAPDLVQEALVSAFAGRARFETADQAEAYVRRAIASRAVDASRRRTRERLALDRAGARTGAVVTDEDSLPGADVVRALASLTPRERACVVLRQMEDLSVAETAAALGLSEGAVKRYTSDAIKRLGALLGATSPRHDHETTTVEPTAGTEVRRGR
ncbi:RNA polymerase sigma factor [Cellulomonas sp. S1-8]|uniref:RNA polymerase sigma factor n=1 Tax=Cellulomonas sp. S1-8 TaxID=2904790 RepID=UPI002243437B|nr:sigma-70 family RNA polymerase sigma factor [Cellulomonas sp. S1-8]UZN02107.1 sigma-70 family RNA polymerase sigma factor [Cellulomonas sp. S1-8]